MSGTNGKKRSWQATLTAWVHPRAVAMLFLGFSAGIPILLIFSTLSVWLREAGVSRSAVTFFSWAALGYSFKFIWAPIVDLLPLPLLTTKLGRRRAWLLVSQLCVIVAISGMAYVDPALPDSSLTVMALAAVMLGFSSATQDIVIDAYRIECVETSMQAMLASMYIAGYRIGMLVAGAGSLFLASYLGTSSEAYSYEAWRMTYLVMAGVMLVGVATTLVIAEPELNVQRRFQNYTAMQYARFLSLFIIAATAFATAFFYGGELTTELKTYVLGIYPVAGTTVGFFIEMLRFLCALFIAGLATWGVVLTGWVDRQMVQTTYVNPVSDFFLRYGGKPALLLLALVGCYRISDIVLGVISNVFYIDIGFSKNIIAGITKTFGLGMTLLGGFLGGMLTIRFGIHSLLFTGALLSAATNLLFMLLAGAGADVSLLTLVIAADNLSAGLATTAFVAYLSAMTSVSFTAVQYAIFSSLMSLFPKLIGGYSGTMVSSFGYEKFFLITALMGIPVLFLVWLVRGVVETDRL